MIQLSLTKQILALIQSLQDKNYFFDNEAIVTQINNRDTAIARGQSNAADFTDSLIRREVLKCTRLKTLINAYKLHAAVQAKDSAFLLSRVRYDQKLSLSLFKLFTGVDAGKTNKEIAATIQNFCN